MSSVQVGEAVKGTRVRRMVITTIDSLRARLGTGCASVAGVTRAVVMTMGALHDGHAALMHEARRWLREHAHDPEHAEVVATVFVNPLQFNDPDDLASYPRTMSEDIALCSAAGVDVVFAPTVNEMYPDGDPQITVVAGALGDDLDGAHRPGHFTGMLTVVNRLLMLTHPAAAFFGEKDYQQLALIQRMVADLLIPVQIVGVPTVRDADGLALSSRNRRLGDARVHALAVPRTLEHVQRLLDEGRSADAAAAEAATWLQSQPEIEQVDYVAVRAPHLGAAPMSGEGRALVAAHVGGVRLIDNCAVLIGMHS